MAEAAQVLVTFVKASTVLEGAEGPDEQGIEYESSRVRCCPVSAGLERSRAKYPVIEFEDGTVYREESKTWPGSVGELGRRISAWPQ